jgi:hypothetical protein
MEFKIEATASQVSMRHEPCTNRVCSNKKTEFYCSKCEMVILPWKPFNSAQNFRARFHRNIAELNDCGSRCRLCKYLASYTLRSPKVRSRSAKDCTAHVLLFPENGEFLERAGIAFEYGRLDLEIERADLDSCERVNFAVVTAVSTF